jgi:uncharacterized protein (TIGR02996 family)
VRVCAEWRESERRKGDTVSDGETFIAAICACPEDDTARLVFADWLEEHGEHERAAYIRNMILTPSRILVFKEQRDWMVLPEGILAIWGRGFVESVTCTAADFLRHADALLREHPITRVRLTTTEGLFMPSLQPGLLAERWPGIEFEVPT